MTSFHWYAVRLRPRFERSVAFYLDRLCIEHFLPLQRFSRQSIRGIRSIELPLFPGVVFCNCDAQMRRSVMTIPGVLAFINVIAEQDIADLRRIVEAGCPVQSWPYTSQGATMTIEKGPLRGVKCIRQTASGTPRFIFSIHMLHRSLALKINHVSGIPYTRPRSKAG
ncbi:MAG: hypothetical protein DMG18_10375 [Acidobacteria bacterium]|nr:MAG: hypothetical protein DMG18_10375 [Acidobacteriota bacterium]